MPLVVQFGPFRFKDKDDLDRIRLAIKESTPTAGLTLVGSSINGQSLQWAVNGASMTEEELYDQLAAAYCSLGIYTYGTPTGNRSVARFCD